MKKFDIEDQLKESVLSMPEETLETAGCTGGCECYKDGLPDCGKCSQERKDAQ